eukprot:GHVS01072157.1.p5 GENE.GHVS01072157.1~~GHVS01072157.1.p5  ORF type:complete len:135 (+),score=40.51 GHVS01072157.1:742-1146(+)
MPLIEIIDVAAGNDASEEFNLAKKRLKNDPAEINRRIPSARCCVLRTKARTYSFVFPATSAREQSTFGYNGGSGGGGSVGVDGSSCGDSKVVSESVGVDRLCAAVDVLIGRHGPMIWKTAMETTDNVFDHSTYY